MATRSKVKVLGTTYYITTSGSEDRVRRIEEQMNEQLAAIQEQRPSLSTLDALVILSLNLMDEITDAENSTDRMREQLSQYLEDAAKARMELEDQRCVCAPLWFTTQQGLFCESGSQCPLAVEYLRTSPVSSLKMFSLDTRQRLCPLWRR